MLDFIIAGGFSMLILLALGIAILIPAVKFARNADPQRLSLIRALTVAISFATIVGVTSGLAKTAHVVAGLEPKEDRFAVLLQGFAESITNVILGGSIVADAWILVAVGVRRMPKD